VANPQLYGLLVSPNFKAALVRALNEAAVDTASSLARTRAALNSATPAGRRAADGHDVLAQLRQLRGSVVGFCAS